MRFRNDDFISILAITSSAALSLTLTAAFLSRPHSRGHEHEVAAHVHVQVEVPRFKVQHIPLEHAPVIPGGFRAVSVEVDQLVTSDGQLAPGARVDVYNQIPRKAGVSSIPLGGDLLVIANYPIPSDWSSGESQRWLLTLLVPTPDADRVIFAAADADVLALGRPEGNLVVFRQPRR
jgi:hypothetical protein